MAVYERTYKRYAGAMTPQWTRFLVLPRFVFQDVFKSKLFLIFFISSFVFPVLMGGVIYLRHNASFLEAFPDFNLDDLLAIDAAFFRRILLVQFLFGFLLALFVGPGLVSRDLANNGLPLYLSRPVSRAEYVLGKFSVLAILLSAITWLLGWALFALEGNFAGWKWMVENARIAAAIFLGSWIWIVTVSLLALALSAWVRWRPVATFLMLMVPLAGDFFGGLTPTVANASAIPANTLSRTMTKRRGASVSASITGNGSSSLITWSFSNAATCPRNAAARRNGSPSVLTRTTPTPMITRPGR